MTPRTDRVVSSAQVFRSFLLQALLSGHWVLRTNLGVRDGDTNESALAPSAREKKSYVERNRVAFGPRAELWAPLARQGWWLPAMVPPLQGSGQWACSVRAGAVSIFVSRFVQNAVSIMSYRKRRRKRRKASRSSASNS